MPGPTHDVLGEYYLGRYMYLVEDPNHKHPEEKSVIKTFGGRAAIIRRRLFIVWSEQSKHFYVFESIAKYLKFIEDVPEKKRHYFEVVFSEQKQRPKFDIDGGDAEYVERIRKTIKALVPTGTKIIICDSSSSTKFSRHIIVDKWYKNSEAAKKLMDDVVANVDGRNYIDESVYKDIQYFRLTGSAKLSGAIKKILTPGAKFEQTLIGSYKLR